MAVSRYYSSVATPTTLTGGIGSGTTTIGVSSPTGYPTSFPFTAAIDYGTATEELVDVTAASVGTWTVTRGVDGTSAQSHSVGAPVRHVTSARDSADSRTHEAATAAVHGVTGTLVGTSDTQVLANKTLTAPTLNGGALSGTLTGAPTVSGNPVFSGTPNFTGVPNLGAGATLAGTFTGSPTLSGNPAFSGNPNFTGVPIFNTPAGVLSQRATSTGAAWRTSVTGDVTDRYYVDAAGKLHWGTGAIATDTVLYRQAAGSLKTDGDYSVGGALSTTGNATVGGNLTAANMNLGAWGAWSPAWTTATGLHSPGYGNAIIVGSYAKLGRILFLTLGVTFGSTTNFGSGAGGTDNWQFSLPAGLTASAAFAGTQAIAGMGRATQNAGATAPFAVHVNPAGTDITMDTSGGRADATALVTGGTLDSVTPWTWASGNVFQFSAVLETTT